MVTLRNLSFFERRFTMRKHVISTILIMTMWPFSCYVFIINPTIVLQPQRIRERKLSLSMKNCSKYDVIPKVMLYDSTLDHTTNVKNWEIPVWDHLRQDSIQSNIPCYFPHNPFRNITMSREAMRSEKFTGKNCFLF